MNLAREWTTHLVQSAISVAMCASTSQVLPVSSVVASYHCAGADGSFRRSGKPAGGFSAQCLNSGGGHRNLLDALEGLGQTKVVAQSRAWTMRLGLEADAVSSLEEAVLAGFFYGPATYFEGELPPAPQVHTDTAAARTLAALELPSGIVTIVDD
jgi:hypothetical protein